jgi:hypothetical protein
MTDIFTVKYAVNRLLQGDRLARRRNSAFMDSCQLIRKETKMDVVHLNQKQLPRAGILARPPWSAG